MAFSLYHASVPQYLQILPAVVGTLDKAEAWATENGLSGEEILGKQLAPDMWPLTNQFRQVAGHSARAIEAISSGIFTPLTTPSPLDFAELRTILTDALATLQNIDADTLDAQADKEVAFEIGGQVRMRFVASDFILTFSQPNFFFHTTAAYSILRHLGVPIGKRDYLGTPKIIQPA
ncbi:DUF1993 domain-containing protein [Sphingobium sufflavum]|uniref:DUF1993 domain-containing protein n=1 Tax=Sphingobium sufflavum TaxID=1129547 RepID=UPI001F3241B4|nr:DUF1993 domain-containing protein [Sphingobium sufflavum]MCE7797028.1 DUF1993 domain-containing protein [Sphingobium sufflavum]